MPVCPTCLKSFADGTSRCPEDDVALVPEESLGDPELAAGTSVGDYEIARRIGSGGFGTVYEAVHTLIGKRAAIKVLDRAANAELVSRFVTEARTVNKIGHAHIVDIFSFGALGDGRRYFVMELINGESLSELLERTGSLEPALCLSILRQLGRALDAAHAAKIIHRDIKPANVMVRFDEDGVPQVKLLDFGIAKLLDGAGDVSHRTSTGAPIGTPHYMSPEQCRGEPVDYRTDIYALGVLAFEALTGRRPFHADSLLKLLMMHASADPPLASSVEPALGTWCDQPLLALLAKDPAARPQSAGEAVERLAAAARAAGHTSMSLMPPAAKRERVAPAAASDPPSETASTLGIGAARIPHPAVAADTGDGSALATVQPTPSRRPVLLIALALAGAVGAYWLVTGSSDRHEGAEHAASAQPAVAAPAGSASAAPAPVASATSLPTSSPAAARIRFSVRTRTAGAIAYLDGKELGAVPDTFSLERATGRHELVVKAPGRVTLRRPVDLGADAEIDADLEPAPVGRKKAGDLEF